MPFMVVWFKSYFFFGPSPGSIPVGLGASGRGALLGPLKNPVKAWLRARGGPPAGRGPGQLAERRQTGVLVDPGPSAHGAMVGSLRSP